MMDKIDLGNPLLVHALDHAAIGMAIVGVDGKLLKVNHYLCNSLGYEKQELLELTFQEITHPDDLEKDLYHFHLLLERKINSYHIEKRYIHKDKHEIWVSLSVSLVKNEQDEPLFIVSQVQDITKEKLTEKKLREKEDRYQRLVEESPDGVIIIRDGKCFFINETGVELLGAENKQSIIGRPIYDFVHPRDLKRFKQIDIRGESAGPFVKRFIRMDGKVIDVELKTMPTIYQDQTATHVIMRDISERKQAQELIINSEKLKVAGQLAAGIAHEVRNPLTAIKGFFQMMQGDLKGNKMYFDVIASEINRIETILNELLVLAKPQEAKFERKSLEMILNHVITLLETQTNLNSIEIVKNIESNLPLIECDENQLKQVFINFLKNAIEAMSQGGKITIDVRKQNADSIVIRIVDQGSGIPEHLLNRIGEPFFTTKEKGTGLGLMISKNIIEEHQGKININSSANGTNVEILLPFS
ncbi:PAS domain S-box protein [Bacillus sp. FJAT-29790]|uniref:PAS domain-containing sensor histidine kinase n=1 Tax=Bacillus sp. FJAT-29790 TaxID=1895002 RepID=UPI001C21FFB1|nr:PAS domain S-box protein [Bacillus sp. FJAT-29790]MBU8880974.1 PAS domain S-box protein [Bacillus sp. FJAT-29790]